ncbi:MAG: SDR family NAD(P)-dependent oxidoreductase [Nitrospirae bacterium]|nr:SDR family NAD(P)-dependent oxidoreductase [Nitrospirota bacterium]
MVCLITGSSRGLGKEIALAFGRRGHQVVVHYKERKEEAEDVASQIKESMAIKADAGNIEEVKSLVDRVVQRWGGIDILVNNAGITKEELLLKASEKDFDELINTNLKGPFNFIRAVAPLMVIQKSGHIINISSIAGVQGKAGLSAYSSSKAGIIGLTMSAAKEFSEHSIMVNAVLPGYMLTDMGIASNEKAKELALNDSLVKSFSDPNNVADFICYLSETKGITGQVFNLDSRIL